MSFNFVKPKSVWASFQLICQKFPFILAPSDPGSHYLKFQAGFPHSVGHLKACHIRMPFMRTDTQMGSKLN